MSQQPPKWRFHTGSKGEWRLRKQWSEINNEFNFGTYATSKFFALSIDWFFSCRGSPSLQALMRKKFNRV